LTVTIARMELYFYFSYLSLDTKPVSLEELQAEFKRASRLNPAVTLSIQADRDAPLGLIVKVKDAAKEAGIKSISVAAGPLEPNAPSVLETNPGERSGKPRPSEAASSNQFLFSATCRLWDGCSSGKQDLTAWAARQSKPS